MDPSCAALSWSTGFLKCTRMLRGKDKGSSGNKTEQAVEDETAPQKAEKVHRKGKAHVDIRITHPQNALNHLKCIRVPARTGQNKATLLAPRRSHLSLTQRGIPKAVCKALWSLVVKDGLLGTLNTLPALS